MKNKIITLTILLLSSTIALGQLRYGIRAGGGVASIKFKPNHVGLLGNFKPKTSFNASLFAEYSFNEDIVFESGIGYINTGFKYGLTTLSIISAPNDPLIAFNDQGTCNLSYINIPFIAKYNFSEFSVGGGVQVGYLAKIKGWGNFKKTDLGATIVGEYNISKKLIFSAKYLFGISNLSKSSIIKTKNRDLSINIGYRFK